MNGQDSAEALAPSEGPEVAAHLELEKVSKSFGGTQAVDDVSLSVRAGSIHAFVGENGAGKSTLGRIIAGVFPPDQGRLILQGTPVVFRSPRQALEHGIALVAQELALVPQMTVAQNVYLGAEPRRMGFVDRKALVANYRRLAASAGFDIPARVPVGTLRVGRQQQVEILRALARDAQLIVFDEPTAALSAAEADAFHKIARSLAASGRTVILVSHFLNEVLELADTITILRDGHVVRTSDARAETESTLISGMLGRSLTRAFPAKVAAPPDALPVLVAEDVVAPGVRGVSITVKAGEIVGLAGLIGAGRSELARAIYGATPLEGGNVRLGTALLAGRGKVVGGIAGRLADQVGGRAGSAAAASIAAGLSMIPESRKDEGLILSRPVRENVSMASLPVLNRWGFVRRRDEKRQVRDGLKRVSGTRAIELPAVALSGGNQQKLLFARALLRRPRVLIADEPTRGVDVGAKREIYEHLVALAAAGVGILLISSEVEELLGLAHRVVVMRGGRTVAELEGDAMTESAVLEAAFGSSPAAA